MASRLLAQYIVAYRHLINGTGFGNWFRTKYLRLQFLLLSFCFAGIIRLIALFYVIYLLY